MSVVNMFRKEALRNQYKSNELGRSLIKQPSIINKAIIVLLCVFIIGMLVINLSSFHTSKSYSASISPENYVPVVHNKRLIINKALVKEGTKVNNNTPLFSASSVNANGQMEQVIVRANQSGYFFQERLAKNLIEPFQPLAYILPSEQSKDLAIWVNKSSNIYLKANQKVTLINQSTKIDGVISMVVGSDNNKEQRIYIKVDNQASYHLAPNASFNVLVKNQPERVINLIK